MLSAARPGLLPRSQTTSITQKLLIQVINSGINTEIWAVLPRHAPWPSHERLWVRFSAWAFCNPISPHGRGLLLEIYKCFSDHPLKMTAIYKIALVIRTDNGAYFSWSPLLSVVWLWIVFIVWRKYDCFLAAIERHRSEGAWWCLVGHWLLWYMANSPKMLLKYAVINWKVLRQTKTDLDAIASLVLPMENLNYVSGLTL